uniref:Uncharacterized protein n=1 Tax=Zosterops lateralis melanops TaxID=1220523 RepID=A0A8D2NTU7_ZOSLA
SCGLRGARRAGRPRQPRHSGEMLPCQPGVGHTLPCQGRHTLPCQPGVPEGRHTALPDPCLHTLPCQPHVCEGTHTALPA